MTKNKQSVGYLYDVALLLVCLAFLSSYFASGLLAKFVSGGGKDDGARVAQWSASASAGAHMELLPSGNGRITYPITITRNAESASTCHITVVFDVTVIIVIILVRVGAEVAAYVECAIVINISVITCYRNVSQHGYRAGIVIDISCFYDNITEHG